MSDQPTPKMSSELEIVLAELRPLRESMSAIPRLEERTAHIQAMLVRLDETVNGNGKPGMKWQMEEHDDRLEALEIVREDERQAKKDEQSERRKFKWAVLMAIAAAMLDIATRLLPK